MGSGPDDGIINSNRFNTGRFDALPDADRATVTLPARQLQAFLKTEFARSHAGEIRVTGPEEVERGVEDVSGMGFFCFTKNPTSPHQSRY